MKLTEKNYFSKRAHTTYMSYSQFKLFLECENKAMASIKGDYVRPASDALLVGSYIDAVVSDELESFIEKNPDILTKSGNLKAQYKYADDAVKVIESDKMVLDYLSGNKQTIQTGEINGVPFKTKIDILFDDIIVDFKYVKDVRDIWDDNKKQFVPFWKFYRYDIQAAIYQYINSQHCGKMLDYYLVVLTKATPTKPTEKHIFKFSQLTLDNAIREVHALAPRFDKIKKGELQPNECGKCDYYIQTHNLTEEDIKEI